MNYGEQIQLMSFKSFQDNYSTHIFVAFDTMRTISLISIRELQPLRNKGFHTVSFFPLLCSEWATFQLSLFM